MAVVGADVVAKYYYVAAADAARGTGRPNTSRTCVACGTCLPSGSSQWSGWSCGTCVDCCAWRASWASGPHVSSASGTGETSLSLLSRGTSVADRPRGPGHASGSSQRSSGSLCALWSSPASPASGSCNALETLRTCWSSQRSGGSGHAPQSSGSSDTVVTCFSSGTGCTGCTLPRTCGPWKPPRALWSGWPCGTNAALCSGWSSQRSSGSSTSSEPCGASAPICSGGARGARDVSHVLPLDQLDI